MLRSASRPLYLHFLDRELMTCMGTYHSMQYSVVRQDLQLALMSTYEPAYLSTSLVFENRFARRAFAEYVPLFQNGHIEMELKENSLKDFHFVKVDQYIHRPDLYGFYMDDTWERIADAGPSFRQKLGDTSQLLEASIASDIEQQSALDSARRLGLTVDYHELAALAPYAADAIRNRGRRAVTRLLFSPLYSRMDATALTQRTFDIKISEHYVRTYVDERGGTIATGLASAMNYFSYLCPTRPLHDLSLWRRIYHRMGCLPTVRTLRPDEIMAARETSEFQVFVDQVRRFLSWADSKVSAGQVRQVSKSRDARAQVELLVLSVVRPVAPTPRGLDEFLVSAGRTGEALASLMAGTGTMSAPAIGLTTFPGGSGVVQDKVFVIYGRNDMIRRAVFELLRAAGLKPLEWEHAVALTRKGSPYVGEVLDAAFNTAQAVVVVFTGDDLAALQPALRVRGETETPSPQPRPNVILEAGMALGRDPDRTVIVAFGKMRDISDLAGRHTIRFEDTPEKRKTLLTRLQSAGCAVDLEGTDWMRAGDFSAIV